MPTKILASVVLAFSCAAAALVNSAPAAAAPAIEVSVVDAVVGVAWVLVDQLCG